MSDAKRRKICIELTAPSAYQALEPRLILDLAAILTLLRYPGPKAALAAVHRQVDGYPGLRSALTIFERSVFLLLR